MFGVFLCKSIAFLTFIQCYQERFYLVCMGNQTLFRRICFQKPINNITESAQLLKRPEHRYHKKNDPEQDKCKRRSYFQEIAELIFTRTIH